MCCANWGRWVEALCPPSEPTPLNENTHVSRANNFYKVAPRFLWPGVLPMCECFQRACASNESPYAPSPMQATIDCCAHIRRCLCDRHRAVSFVCARQCDLYVMIPLRVLDTSGALGHLLSCVPPPTAGSALNSRRSAHGCQTPDRARNIRRNSGEKGESG